MHRAMRALSVQGGWCGDGLLLAAVGVQGPDLVPGIPHTGAPIPPRPPPPTPTGWCHHPPSTSTSTTTTGTVLSVASCQLSVVRSKPERREKEEGGGHRAPAPAPAHRHHHQSASTPGNSRVACCMLLPADTGAAASFQFGFALQAPARSCRRRKGTNSVDISEMQMSDVRPSFPLRNAQCKNQTKRSPLSLLVYLAAGCLLHCSLNTPSFFV
jgi:hypothetical protein